MGGGTQGEGIGLANTHSVIGENSLSRSRNGKWTQNTRVEESSQGNGNSKLLLANNRFVGDKCYVNRFRSQ